MLLWICSTGEKLGVDYLLAQTGEPMARLTRDDVESSVVLEVEDVAEDNLEDGSIADLSDPLQMDGGSSSSSPSSETTIIYDMVNTY